MWKKASLVAAILIFSATAAAAAEPLIDDSEFKERENCLYREVGRLNASQITTDPELDALAQIAADLCSQAIRKRLLRASSSVEDGEHVVKYDRLQTVLRAKAIAQELVEYGVRQK